MKKLLCLCLIVCICSGNIFLPAADSLAFSNTEKYTLSPAISINLPDIRSAINSLSKTPAVSSKIILEQHKLEELGLDELSDFIIKQCIKNDFSLLKLNWHKKHLDYQQFIKEAAALNQALSYLISSADIPSGMDFNLFRKQAMLIRIEMIEHYQAPLSETGAAALDQIKKSLLTRDILQKLMRPPSEWFIPLFDKNRLKVLEAECNPPLLTKGVYNPAPYAPCIVATWGCSTQCDHCDGGSVIEVTSFPWVWIEKSQSKTITPRHISRIKLEYNLNDYFRDYYDFVYDRDASDVIQLFQAKFALTSGFAPGSVGERALKKALPYLGLFHVSIAPSAWMRGIIKKKGVKGYLNYLINIKTIVENYMPEDGTYKKRLFKFEIFDFNRITDNADMFREIFDFGYKENGLKSPRNIWVNGNFYRLVSAGLINPEKMQSPVIFFKKDASEEDLKGFLNGDVANTALFPDGQAARVSKESKEELNRSYETITGLGPIGRRKIACWYCDNIACEGKKGVKCTGRAKIFKRRGLSENGGFTNSFLIIGQSI